MSLRRRQPRLVLARRDFLGREGTLGRVHHRDWVQSDTLTSTVAGLAAGSGLNEVASGGQVTSLGQIRDRLAFELVQRVLRGPLFGGLFIGPPGRIIGLLPDQCRDFEAFRVIGPLFVQ